MFPGYKPGLATNILHLNIKDHVAAYKLMIWRWGHTIHQDVKSNMHIFHLLFNRITPKGSTSGGIDSICLLHCLGNVNPILVSVFLVSSTLTLN